MQVSTEVRDKIRASISDAYYEARNAGRTMDQAADDATDAVVRIFARTGLTIPSSGPMTLVINPDAGGE